MRMMSRRLGWRWGALVVLVFAAAVFYLWGRDRTPSEFTERTVLPACGAVSQQDLGAIPAGAAQTCLLDAMRDGRGAELVVDGMTDEGARVVAYFRAVPGKSGLEIFDDRSADDFGTEDWVRRTCPAATGPTTLGECESVGW